MKRYFNNSISLFSCILILILEVNTVCCISVKAQTYPEEHVAYYESDRYAEDITGYFGVLSDIHEYTKDDSSMLNYSIVDDLKKMITFDWGNLTGREEYEVLLAEIMMNDASLSGLDDLYKKNLKDSIIEVAKYIINQFTNIAVDKNVQEPTKRIQELIVKMEELPYDSVEFSKSYEEYKDIVIKRTDLKKAKKYSSYFGIAITAGNSLYESAENLFTTIEYGEAYKNVSDEFVTVLKKFRVKLNDKDSVKEIKKKYNITDPFFVDAMTKATNDFADKMERYKEDGALEVGTRATAEAGGKLLFDVGADKFSDFVRAVLPLVNGTLIISETGQLVMDINPSTDFDRIVYSGNMFARLYYIEVYLEELLYDLGNELKRNMDEKNAYLFDEGVSIYKSVESSAEKYASIYVQKKIEEFDNTISEKEKSWLPWDRSKLNKAQKDLILFTDFQKRLTDAESKTEAISCHSSNSSQEEFGSGTDKNVVYPFLSTIDDLVSRYGSLRIVQNNGEWQNEANGLCYLNLIDFTGDGEDELMAVCKNEDEEHYSCFVYQQINNQAKQVFLNEKIECDFDFDYETLYISSSKDTGYVIGSGWEGDDAEDTTFYWCNKDGYFEPVYHLKGYWDTDQDKFVSEEKAIVIDLFDDDHRDEIWNNHKSITLRTYDEYDADGDFFNTQKLQKTIDDTLRKLRADTKDLPLIEDGIDDMLPLVNAQVNFFRQESESANHITSCKKEDDFWRTLGSYCNSNLISGNNTNEVFLQDGEVVISSAEIIDMGYSLFDDFEGVIPNTNISEYGTISYAEGEDTYHFLPASMHDYIYKEKSEPILNDDGTITITYLYEESFWGDREGPKTFAYDITFRLNDHVNKTSDNPYYYTIISVEKLTESKKNESVADSDDNKVYEYVLSQLHGLWYSSTMGPDGPMSKMICEGNDFNGEIHEIVEYNEGYLVRLVDGYSYYFGKDLDSCILVEGWDITENNTSGASGWWKPNEEQRKQYGD